MDTLYTSQSMNPGMRASLWSWQTAPCTFAVVAGPMITTVNHLMGAPELRLGGLSLAQMVRGLLCVTMLLSLLLSNRLRLLDHPIVRPVLLLSVYAIVTVTVGPYPVENILIAVKLGFVLLVFANAFHMAERRLITERWLAVSAWIVLLCMVISQAIGVMTRHAAATYEGQAAATYESSYATAGLLDQPAVTAALTLSALPTLLSCFPAHSHSVLGVLLLLVSLFFTMRRTELSAAVVAVLLVLIRYAESVRRRVCSRVVASAVVLLGVSAAVIVLTPAGQDLLARFRDLDPREGTGSGRYVFWAVTLDRIVDRGIAAKLCGEGMESIRDVTGARLGQALGTHNDWLGLTHAFGVIGLAAFVWWHVGLVRFTSYLRRSSEGAFQGALAALVIFTLVSIGQGGFYDPSLAMIYAGLGFWAGQRSYWG